MFDIKHDLIQTLDDLDIRIDRTVDFNLKDVFQMLYYSPLPNSEIDYLFDIDLESFWVEINLPIKDKRWKKVEHITAQRVQDIHNDRVVNDVWEFIGEGLDKETKDKIFYTVAYAPLYGISYIPIKIGNYILKRKFIHKYVDLEYVDEEQFVTLFTVLEAIFNEIACYGPQPKDRDKAFLEIQKRFENIEEKYRQDGK